MKMTLLLVGIQFCLFCCVSCVSSKYKGQLVEKIFNDNALIDICASKSCFSYLGSKEGKECAEEYMKVIADFYGQNLSISEIKSYARFQEEPMIQKIRNDFWNGGKISSTQIKEVYQLIDTYPVIKKISSPEFQFALNKYLLDKYIEAR